jgi:WD40 repeat protein
MFDLTTGRILFTTPEDSYATIDFSRDSNRVVFAGPYRNPVVRDARTGRELHVLRGHQSSGSTSAMFSPEGSRIVTTDAWSHVVRLFDARTGKVIFTMDPGDTDPHRAFFAAGGERIVGVGSWSTRVWDAADGRLLAVLDASGSRGAASPDGRLLFVADHPAATLWDISRLTAFWETLARDACVNLLGASGRAFRKQDIEADPLLIDRWPALDRDVCEGARGVAGLKETRAALGLR